MLPMEELGIDLLALLRQDERADCGVSQTRQYVRDWLERTEQMRRVVIATSQSSVDHANMTNILDVYGKVKAVCQEARIELPRLEQQVRTWLFEPLTPEQRAACDEISRNLERIQDAAESMNQKAERLRAAAGWALGQRKA